MDQFYNNNRENRLERTPSSRHQDSRALSADSLYGRNSGTNNEPEQELLVYWNIIRRNLKTLALFAFAFAALGILIGLPQKPVYRARTSIEVLSLNEDFMNMKESSPTSSNDLSSETSELQTEATLLESSALLEAVQAKLDDRPQPPKVKGRHAAAAGFNWRRVLHLEPEKRTPREVLLAKAAASLKVRALPKTRLIEITVDSTDPDLATEYASTLADKFIEQNVERRWSTTQKTGALLGREIGEARANLQRSEAALQTYAGNSGLIFSDQQDETPLSTQKLQQVQEQLAQATSERIIKQSRYELAQHSSPDSLPDVLTDSALRDSASKITELRRQIANLSAMFTPEYSKLRQANAQLAETQAAFDRDRRSILQRIRNDFEEANRREQLLLGEYQAQTKEVTGQGQKAVQYNVLKREVESNRKLYDTMLQQYKQSSIASAMGASKVQVVDPAEAGEKPITPNYKVNCVIGLFTGLFSGILFVLTRDKSDRSLREPGDSQFWTSLPELGTIPNAFSSHHPLSATSRFLGHAPKKPASLVSPSDKFIGSSVPGLLSESVRNVATSILFMDEDSRVRPRVIGITSPEPGDGKTTIVSHLGIALSEIQGNVLIIDADLRRPRLHEVFDLSNERGLSDLLRDPALRHSALDGLIQQTSFPGLHVLTSGPASSHAASLLYSPSFAELLRKVRVEYSMVLVDTAPMLEITDARVVGRLADAVALVARAGQTSRDALMAANQRFAEDNVRVLGTIFNDFDPKNSSNRFYSRRKNGYRSYWNGEENSQGGKSFSAANAD